MNGFIVPAGMVPKLARVTMLVASAFCLSCVSSPPYQEDFMSKPTPKAVSIEIGADGMPLVVPDKVQVKAGKNWVHWVGVDQFRIVPKDPAVNLRVEYKWHNGVLTGKSRLFRDDEVGIIKYNVIITTRDGRERLRDPDIEVIP
ncbi:MAG TPA: hypothetical protein VNM92_11385 [Thermoanaerobaculia bacterium]|nr:hypothetical protein [Thermoanaerobaculia bacterium]